ncbi:hypothetical protein GCM10012285_23740 [Streptomyces kronopolitis]|uniref:Uncharacterized protein n=1 Tax=Streptomyces kronopolitis TaxID=1612435 RepID=A0ABQ2JD69_9ACTN|nr:hypothetical protein GCM10012285_23740 [Streptomyces kronopolitis]
MVGGAEVRQRHARRWVEGETAGLDSESGRTSGAAQRGGAEPVSLWVAATHIQTALQHAPRLAVVSPTNGCGKSRVLDVLHETVRQPMITLFFEKSVGVRVPAPAVSQLNEFLQGLRILFPGSVGVEIIGMGQSPAQAGGIGKVPGVFCSCGMNADFPESGWWRHQPSFGSAVLLQIVREPVVRTVRGTGTRVWADCAELPLVPRQDSDNYAIA